MGLIFEASLKSHLVMFIFFTEIFFERNMFRRCDIFIYRCCAYLYLLLDFFDIVFNRILWIFKFVYIDFETSNEKVYKFKFLSKRPVIITQTVLPPDNNCEKHD